MKMNNNTDSKATLQLNQEIQSQNCQTSKMELYLGNSQRLKSASHFCEKKTLSRFLTGIQVRKIGDDTDNKETSKLTLRGTFRNRPNITDGDFFETANK